MIADKRRHRGPHPRDAEIFAPDHLPGLRTAVRHLGWLLTRGYSDTAALKLVGDHFQLHRRQRVAVRRCAASDSAVAGRRARRVPMAGRQVAVDGFNVLVTIEAALSGGVLLRGADGLLRDLASMHGSYRKVHETGRAIDLLVLALSRATNALWVLDRPVSNSGRVAALLREKGFDVRLEDDADRALAECGRPVATADGPLLDRIAAGIDLTGPVVAGLRDARVIDLAASA